MTSHTLVPWWRPDQHAARRPFLTARGRVLRALRSFFQDRDYCEVETPIVQRCPGMEPHLGVFRTRLNDPDHGSLPRLLQTSPELTMKKLLVAGEPRLFQFAKVFRNAERSETHHPEFTMLEWYRVGADLDGLMAETEALCRAAVGAVDGSVPSSATRDALAHPAPYLRMRVSEAFAAFADGADPLAGIDGSQSAGDEPDPGPLRWAVRRCGLTDDPDDRWEDLFFRLMLNRVDPGLAALEQPVFLTHWPAPMAALAQRDPDDPRLAERFELYVGGLELANAFRELTDPVEQRARFEADAALRVALYGEGEAMPIDEDFLAALAHGLPACSGIALGFDRLVMACTGAERIDQVLWAPVDAMP